MELVSIDKTSCLSFILMVAIGRVVDNWEAITTFVNVDVSSRDLHCFSHTITYAI